MKHIKLFIAWIGSFFFQAKRRKARKEAEEKARKIVDQKFNQSTLSLAKEMTEMHAAFKRAYPRNYIQKMQPYFIVLSEYMKEYDLDPIGAALKVVTKKTPKGQIVGYFATAAEMLNNLNPTPSNGATTAKKATA